LGLGAKFLSQNHAERINKGIFEKKYKDKLIKGKRHLIQEEQLKKDNEERAKKRKKEMESTFHIDIYIFFYWEQIIIEI